MKKLIQFLLLSLVFSSVGLADESAVTDFYESLKAKISSAQTIQEIGVYLAEGIGYAAQYRAEPTVPPKRLLLFGKHGCRGDNFIGKVDIVPDYATNISACDGFRGKKCPEINSRDTCSYRKVSGDAQGSCSETYNHYSVDTLCRRIVNE